MLQHTENEPEPVTAAQTRIKTEELARAVAAIEARRQRDAQALVGTLVIGEAVEELSLDMTPEEILAEVKSQQEEQREQEEASGLYPHEHGDTSNTPSWRMPAWLLAGSIVSALTIIIWWGTANQTQPISSTVYPPPVVTQNYPTVNPHFLPGQAPPTFYRTPPSHMITRIPDGVGFGCAPHTLDRVLTGENLANIQVYDGEEAFLYGRRPFADSLPPVPPTTISYRVQGGWTLIKHKGRVYVRGWAYLPNLAPTSIRVFNTPGAPEIKDKASEITLPTQGIHYEGMYERIFNVAQGTDPGSGLYRAAPGDQLEIRATDVHLDSHAYENW